MPNNKQPLNYASLPIISVLPKPQFAKAKRLLLELEELEETIDTAEERADQVKQELEEIQKDGELEGLRFDDMKFAAVEYAGRRTINRELLIENGVKAAVIERSMKEGAGYVKREFRSDAKEERARRRRKVRETAGAESD